MLAAACLLFATGVAAGGEPDLAGPMDRSLFLSQSDATKRESGTAFFVQVSGRTLLVTAAHVAEETRGTADIGFRDADGTGRRLSLRAVVAGGRDPWRTHPSLDVAAAVVDWERVAEEDRSRLRRLVWPEGSLSAEPPPRGTAVRLVGFPALKGVGDGMSATVLSGHVATRPITSRGDWGEVRAVYMTPPADGGASGSPVYVPGEPPRICGLAYGVSYARDAARYTKLIAADALAEFLRGVAAGP